MRRLTKSDIERQLLNGEIVSWKDVSNADCSIVLGDATKRRLFAFILSSGVREPTGLSNHFTDGLSAAFASEDDPAAGAPVPPTAAIHSGPWRLDTIETEGFGGLNTWRGPAFRLNMDCESLLIEGPNGSGKSSLVGAILWALLGERPRDQAEGAAHEPKPVYQINDEVVGQWPPIACYPPTAGDLGSQPSVRVELTFRNQTGAIAKIERRLSAGVITATVDPSFEVPPVLLETGLFMPVRLASLRLDEGRGRLTDAVQKLTGLDDLKAIANLASGLCHRSREYLSSYRKDYEVAKATFDNALAEARGALESVSVSVPEFKPAETDDVHGEMAMLGRTIRDRNAELSQTVSSDLNADLDLKNINVQNLVVSAIGAAQASVAAGLDGISIWKSLKETAYALEPESKTRILSAVEMARQNGEEALLLLEKSRTDSKFQLKALASNWHHSHKIGPIQNCPLCDQDLHKIPALAEELESLRNAGDLAVRAFDDNVNRIVTELNDALPKIIRAQNVEVLELEPRTALTEEISAAFISNNRHSNVLAKFVVLVSTAIADSPADVLVAGKNDEGNVALGKLNERIAVIRRSLEIADWFRRNEGSWLGWWVCLSGENLAGRSADVSGPKGDGASASENLTSHLRRLMEAMGKAEPYRKGADAMRRAWKAGEIAAEVQRELDRRESIADCIGSLKHLNSLADGVAKDAINGLSGRIGGILERTLLTENLKFRDARLRRKEGVVVRAGFAGSLRIDATLVANTSWLRAVLWAFVFALREEAIEQIGSDPFPLLILDDPQITFDGHHRHRWAQYIAGLQQGPSKLQILLATHDETFLELLDVDRVCGRKALITGPGPELGHVGIFEGDLLNREWAEVTRLGTAVAACDYIAKVRKYVEGLLRIMLRGEDVGAQSAVAGLVLGACRQAICIRHDKGVAPWDRPAFDLLVGALNKDEPAIKYMEMAHHSSGSSLGMSEAEDVRAHWMKKLEPRLHRAFREAGEFYRLHGGLTALHAPTVTSALPEGYAAKVRAIPLSFLGKAAALTDGRVADGRLSLEEFAASKCKRITLAQHQAFRLTGRTLEPVARKGDILLVKEAGEPSARSLVVALIGDRILARRFEIAENDSTIAVLTAQSIDPYQIAPPVIAHRATVELHKIIGVLFDDAAWNNPSISGVEICECGGEASLRALAADTLGLVQVVGKSAVPRALNNQFLIIGKELTTTQALNTLVGKPIIAADNNDNYYFKRLQMPASGQIVLESLDIGGDYPPLLLSVPGNGENCVERVWPVAGVLFELP